MKRNSMSLLGVMILMFATLLSCDSILCEDSSVCRNNEYCSKIIGNCDGEGICTIRPEACIEIWDPVCGCDNKTYGNECEAAAMGINVEYKGECKGPCDDGTDALCLMPLPICTEYEIMAVQNYCYACVNPATCLPWGEPECSSDADCPEGSTCDPCGSSSCPFCDDCIPACIP